MYRPRSADAPTPVPPVPPVLLPVRENPGVVDLATIGVVAVVGFVLVQAISKLPQLPSLPWLQPPAPVGGGDAGGVDPRTGQPAVPGSTVFRLVSLAAASVVNAFYNGEAFVIPAVVSHRGPAGLYVAGIDVAYSNLVGGLVGATHGEPFQTVELNLEVGDDAVFAEYDLVFAGVFTGGCCGALDVRLFVRDTAGRILADHWSDQSMWAV